MPRIHTAERSVTFSELEIYKWKRKFPGSRLPEKSTFFQFEANGDLCDTNVSADANETAQIALANDALELLKKRIEINKAKKAKRLTAR